MARCFPTRRGLPRGRVARRSRGPLLGGLWLRCLTSWRGLALDAELACGTDPIESDELSLRAGQLRSDTTRTCLARALEEAVQLADRELDPPSSELATRRAQVRECRAVLLDLAERLREDGPFGVQGLALASLLVRDAASPLYERTRSASLAETAHTALNALESAYSL